VLNTTHTQTSSSSSTWPCYKASTPKPSKQPLLLSFSRQYVPAARRALARLRLDITTHAHSTTVAGQKNQQQKQTPCPCMMYPCQAHSRNTAAYTTDGQATEPNLSKPQAGRSFRFMLWLQPARVRWLLLALPQLCQQRQGWPEESSSQLQEQSHSNRTAASMSGIHLLCIQQKLRRTKLPIDSMHVQYQHCVDSMQRIMVDDHYWLSCR
jgi:hypothetical protein